MPRPDGGQQVEGGVDGGSGTDGGSSGVGASDAGSPHDGGGSSSGDGSSGSVDASNKMDATGVEEADADAGPYDATGATEGSADGGAAAYDYSVYQHHKNGSRNGLYIDPVLTWTPGEDGGPGTGNAVTMHVLPAFTGAVQTNYAAPGATMGTVSTGIYAQPLYVENGPGGVPAFVVVTELNHVTTYNATTGNVLWDNGPTSTISYGPPVTSGLPCGNIKPLGITGTPFIDYSSGEGVIYFDSMSGDADAGLATHKVWAIRVEDGSVLPNWPVDVQATVPSFNAMYQNQRGALQLVNGVLYVAYGGLNGDCIDPAAPYYGWVVAIPLDSPQQPTSWHTMAPRGAIWASGALPTDGTNVYPVTGNTSAPGVTTFTPPTTWGGGEAVIRLSAGAVFSGSTADYYTPSNWASLDTGDKDLGSASDVLIDMPGTSTPHLVALAGKDQNFYLLNRDNLGGVGAELFKATMAVGMPGSTLEVAFKGAPAAYTTKSGTYVALYIENGFGVGCSNNGNLVAIKITPGVGSANPTASVAWCAPDTALGSPIVTTTDGVSDAIVWDANTSLWGYDGDTGEKIYSAGSTMMDANLQPFNTPIAIGGGRIAVLVNGELFVFSAP